MVQERTRAGMMIRANTQRHGCIGWRAQRDGSRLMHLVSCAQSRSSLGHRGAFFANMVYVGNMTTSRLFRPAHQLSFCTYHTNRETYNLDSSSGINGILLLELIDDRLFRPLCPPVSGDERLVEPREEEPSDHQYKGRDGGDEP